VGLLRWITLIGVFWGIQGCGVHLDSVLQSPIRQFDQLNAALNIRVPSTTEETISLDSQLDKPAVIIFAQDTCDVCGHETEMILSHLSSQQQLKISIVTILIGTTMDDARWWQEMFEVSWPVGVDYKGEYFKQYCPENTVPCMLIYKPGEGVVFTQHGEVSYETIYSYTGPWY
jgi:peroxiredoxin